jgi:hypothetical protein
MRVILKMKVVKWLTNAETVQYPTSIKAVEGGIFKNGMRWNHYIKIWKNVIDIERLNALRTFIVTYKIRTYKNGCNNANFLFDDNTMGCFTLRAWGDLLAATWSQEEDKDYTYEDFGW